MSTIAKLFNLNDTFGAFLIGAFASAILLGVTCLQAYYYFMTYSDGPLIRMTVAALVILEMGQLAIVIHTVYHYLIINYANPVAALELVWSIEILFGVVGVIVLIVQLSYAFRIYHVSGKKKWIPLFIAIVALTHFSMGWVLVASLFRLTSVFGIVGFPETMGKAILAEAAGIDTLIAATLCYHLHQQRTGIKETDKLINRLIKYTINTGALTSVMDLVALSLVIARPKEYLFFSVVLVLGNLYSNSLLATLNSRNRGNGNQSVVSSGGGSMAAHTGTLPPLEVSTRNVTGSMTGHASITNRRGLDYPRDADSFRSVEEQESV